MPRYQSACAYFLFVDECTAIAESTGDKVSMEVVVAAWDAMSADERLHYQQKAEQVDDDFITAKVLNICYKRNDHSVCVR